MAISVWWVVALFVVGPIAFSLLAYRLKIRWLNALTIRLALFFFVVMAIWLGLGFQQPPERPVEVLLLDVSDSIPETARNEALGQAASWLEGGESRQVILFGDGAEYLLSNSGLQASGYASDLLSAVEGLPDLGERGMKVAVASDGNFDSPTDTLVRLAELQLNGVEVIPLQMDTEHYPADAYIESIRGPEDVWEGMTFQTLAIVQARRDGSADLEVLANGEIIGQRVIDLSAGQNVIQLPLITSGSPGVISIQLNIQAAGDEFGPNNTYFKAIRVLPKPSVLLVTGSSGTAAGLSNALTSRGFGVRMISPADFPTSVSELAYSPVVIIHNVLGQAFSGDQIRAIRKHVVENGKSLIFIGGNNSYTLGGYQDTDLAELIPVRLAPPSRVQRVPITFMLVLDRSGSMAGDRESEISPIDLTREGAMRAIETLQADDYLGVLSFSATLSWDVPLGQVGAGSALRDAQDKVSRIPASGGTFMYQALEDAATKLRTIPTSEHLHILLMSDGVSGDGSGDEFDALVRGARADGITISTIALGQESDPERLAAIAQAGGGRFYEVLDPLDLPAVMISESRAVQAENVQLGNANLTPGSTNHPVASELARMAAEDDSFELPTLSGYIALQSKSDLGTEDIYISSNFGDPLLSTWQVGLGRTSAWMGDLGESWAPGIVDEEQAIFWELIIRETLPDPSFGEPDIDVLVGETETTLVVYYSADEYKDLNRQTVFYYLVNQDTGTREVFTLEQIGHRRFQAVLPTEGFGVHPGVLAYQVNEIDRHILVPIEKNYPVEWQFNAPSEGEDRMSKVSPGDEAISYQQWVEESLEGQRLQSRVDWFTILLVSLVLFWPLEIAARRWNMPWRRP